MEETSETVDDQVDIKKISLRPGGWIGYGEDAIYIDRGDERIKVRNQDVTHIMLKTVEWDLAIMSLLLVGIGGYVILEQNPIVGVAFALFGLGSTYRTYAKRYELQIHVENRTKPLSLYPTHPRECHERLVDEIGLESR